MGEEIAFKNGRIPDFQGLMTLTLDRVILHTIVRHSSTCTYTPNFVEIEETFCGWTDRWADGRLRPTLLGRLGGVDPTNYLVTELRQQVYFNTVILHFFFQNQVHSQVGPNCHM